MLIGECRRAGVRRFIYISTIAAKFRDQHRYYYAQSKCQAEELVKSSGLRYTIVRPTIVIGKGAAVLEGLSRLAGAPVIPMFGSGRALVQPVAIEDLIACLAEILEGDAFGNRTVEIGGPEVISMEELLVKIRRVQGKADGSILHLPAKLVAAGVGLLESFLLPLLPFTAGQIASFTNDGVADDDPCVAQWKARMKSVDQMLRAANPA